ncbi:MAG: HDIG domain-containing protein [Tannerella sp.]|jgi:uncharacterized protein|nr:HDIG domain-containing protein [Tannerella sp.]
MNPIEIIEKYYDVKSEAYHILVNHSRSVAEKALTIGRIHPEMGLDLAFVEEAAMLHDIGMKFCDAKEISCFGTYSYICHGYLGADLMREEGFPRHALVCERHTGTGITIEMIRQQDMPLPHRDFMPVTLEEQLICFADKFYSKMKLDSEKSIDKVLNSLSRYGGDTVERFNSWVKLFLG